MQGTPFKASGMFPLGEPVSSVKKSTKKTATTSGLFASEALPRTSTTPFKPPQFDSSRTARTKQTEDISMVSGDDEREHVRGLLQSQLVPHGRDGFMEQRVMPILDDQSVIENKRGDTFFIGKSYMEFAESYQACLHGSATDPLLDVFMDYCDDQIDKLSDPDQFNDDFRFRNPAEEAALWIAERNTWDLISRLYAIRDSGNDTLDVPPLPQHPYATDYQIGQYLIGTNKILSEMITIKEWLESTAPPFQPVEIRDDYFRHTLQHIKGRSRGFVGDSSGVMGGSAGESITTEMDIDSSIRQRKQLAMDDKIYYTSFLRTIFNFIRRGNMNEAVEFAKHCKQPWLAASLMGSLLYTMEFKDSDEVEFDIGDFEGNKERDLFRAACFRLACEDSLDSFERAIYACLSGNVQHALPVCKRWEDYVWAYYSALIDSSLERELRKYKTIRIGEENLYALDSEPVTTLGIPCDALQPVEIFSNLEKSDVEELRMASLDPFRIIQSKIILNQVPELIRLARSELDKEMLGTSTRPLFSHPHVLRVLAHLVIYFRQIAPGEVPEEDGIVILKNYIAVLVSAHKNDIVAIYTSQLPGHLSVDVYAEFLRSIQADSRTRYRYLSLAALQGLDISRIALKTVEYTFGSGVLAGDFPSVQDVDIHSLSQRCDESEIEQIRGLEWLMFEEAMYKEVILNANLLVRRFMAMGKLYAAQEALSSLPSSIPPKQYHEMVEFLKDETMTLEQLSPEAQHLVQLYEANDPNVLKMSFATREWIGYKVLLNALLLVYDWNEHWERRPSRERERERGEPGLKDWVDVLMTKTPKVESHIRKLLQSDWLEFDDERAEYFAPAEMKEITVLKMIYIPYLVLALNRILYETRSYFKQNIYKAIRLADLVAVNETISKNMVESGKMKEFLQGLRLSMLEVVDGSKGKYPDVLSFDE